jgi:hypothetical protein
MLHKEITSEIIASFYFVYNRLGYGFLEKVYGHDVRLTREIRVLFCN